MLYFVVNLPRGPVVGVPMYHDVYFEMWKCIYLLICTMTEKKTKTKINKNSVNPGVLQGSPMTFSGFRSDSHGLCYTTSHCSIPPNVSSLNHTFRLLLCSGNLTYPPSHCSRHDRSTRSHMSSHLVYPETYVISFRTSETDDMSSFRSTPCYGVHHIQRHLPHIPRAFSDFSSMWYFSRLSFLKIYSFLCC
jgi:hypothetical protein